MKKLILIFSTLIVATIQASDIPNPFIDGVLEFHNQLPEDPFHVVSSIKAAGQNYTGTKTEFMAKNCALFAQIESCHKRWQNPVTRNNIYNKILTNSLSITAKVKRCSRFETGLRNLIVCNPSKAAQDLEQALDNGQALFKRLLKEQKDIHPHTIDPHLYILPNQHGAAACMNTMGTQGYVCASVLLLEEKPEIIEHILRHELAHFVNASLDDATTDNGRPDNPAIHVIESNTNTLATCSAPDPLNTGRYFIANGYHADHLRKFINDLQAEQKLTTSK